MKLNLTQPLKDLSGENLKDPSNKVVTLGKILANAIIAVQDTTEPARNYVLSTKCYQDKSIELEKEELTFMIDQVGKAGTPQLPFPNIYKGQILEILSKLKDN